MKIKQEKFDILRIGDDIVVEAGIDEKSLPYVFEIMSTTFYSNPLGSMIREITSNCFDSHIEAGVTDPVIIKKEYNAEDDCFYILFKDVGVGLSPDRMITIFMNYFSSTKRGTDKLIGGFGLGSKTPLSYQDLFYIETVFDGIKYEYIYHKGETKPELDSIHGFENVTETVILIDDSGKEVPTEVVRPVPLGVKTDRGNGTIIKVEIKSSDSFKINHELKSQLCYFDNVYFQDFDVQNDYRIYEGKTFKYKNTEQYSEEIHIVLDKVSYPINYKLLDRKPVKIPIGLKFKIGELPVTPSRESIKYTDEIKNLLNKKIDECIEELRERYEGDNPLVVDILEWSKSRTSRTHIKLGENDVLYIPVDYLPYKSKFREFPELNIPNDIFFMYDIKGIIDYNSESITKQRRYYNDTVFDLIDGNDTVYINHINNSLYKNAYLSRDRSACVIKRKTINYQYMCEALGLYVYKNYERYGNPEHARYYDLDKDGRRKTIILGKAKLIKKYLDYIDNIVKERVKDYDLVNPPEEWITEYKKLKYENDASRLRKKNRKIIVRINDDRRREMSIDALEQQHLIVYKLGHEKEHNIHEAITLIKVRDSLNKYCAKSGYYHTELQKYRILFISIAKTNFKQIKDLPNLLHVTQIHGHYVFQRMFKDFGAAIKIKRSRFLDLRLSDVSNYYNKKQQYLERFVRDNYDNEISYNAESILRICEERNLHNYEIESILKEFEKVYDKLEITKYLEYSTPTKYLQQIFSISKVTKLNENLYSIKQLSNEQEETINESEESRS